MIDRRLDRIDTYDGRSSQRKTLRSRASIDWKSSISLPCVVTWDASSCSRNSLGNERACLIRTSVDRQTTAELTANTSCSRDQMRDLWLAAQQPLEFLLRHAVRVGHTLVLAQMFQPRFDEKGFQQSARLRAVFESSHAWAPSRRRSALSRSSAASNASRFCGATTYSIVRSIPAAVCSF